MALKTLKFQIGKAGITPGIIESLLLAFKNHKEVRISTLKSSGRNRENIESMALDICAKLKEKNINAGHRIIGFTIILKKLSKAAK